MLLRILSLCIVLAGVETLHGIARTVLLAPRIGKAAAIKLSVVSGTVLAFGVCYWLVPGIGLQGFEQHLALGLVLAGFMASFDIAFGKLVMRLKWARIWQDFNPASGNFLSLGLIALCGIPSLVWWLSGG
ncbi:MAG: hypothetical protein KDF54_06095 [Hydrogenophaga sp.]|nr:hypothetical protein [Hydrogenophaga sp.]